MPLTPVPAQIGQLIDRLQLQPHPEGGFYRETWRSDLRLPPSVLPAGYSGHRAAGTSILFLLPTGHCSQWHRVRSAELWFHQAGDPLELVMVETWAASAQTTIHLGRADTFQAVVPPNHWQKAQPIPGGAGYALVACVVVPGFDFADFELSRESRSDSP